MEAEPHGDGIARHIPLGCEKTRVCLDGERIERHTMRGGNEIGIRFIEPDVARVANAEELNIHTAERTNQLIIAAGLLPPDRRPSRSGYAYGPA